MVATRSGVMRRWIGTSMLGIVIAVVGLGGSGGSRSDPAVEAADPVDRQGDPLPTGARMRLGTLRARLPEGIGAVAITPDGRSLIATSYQRELWVCDAANGRSIRRLDTGIKSVRQFALTADGACVAAVGFTFDSQRRATYFQLTLTELANGRRVLEAEWLGRGDIWSLAVAPDGRSIATGDSTGSFQVWDVATGEERLHIQIGERDVKALAFAPDGKILAAACSDVGLDANLIHLWDLDADRAARTLEGHARPVRALAFAPDGKTLASTAEEKDLIVWDVATGREVRRLASANQFQSDVAFAPDGKRLASTGDRGAITVWDVATSAQHHTFQTGRSGSGSLAFGPDGRTIVSNGGAGVLHLWDLTTGRDRFEEPEAHRSAIVGGVRFLDDGRSALTASDDGTVRLWDVETGRQVRVFEHRGWVRALAVAPDGRTLATAPSHPDQEIVLWDLATGRRLRSFPGHGGFEAAVAIGFGPDGRTILSIGRHGDLKVRDATTGEAREAATPKLGIAPRANMPGDFIFHGVFSPDPALLALETGSKVIVIDVATGAVRARQAGRHVAFSSDGKLLAIAAAGQPAKIPAVGGGLRIDGSHSDGTIHLLEWPTGRERRAITIPGQPITAVALSDDGRLLAAATTNPMGRLHIFDASSGRELQTFEGHGSYTSCLEFAPDGRTLASGARDTTALIWDLNPATGPAD